MTVFRRSGAKSWTVNVDLPLGPDGVRRRHYQGGFTTKKAALKAEVQIKRDLDLGTYVHRSTMVVGGYLEEWVRAQHHLKPSTRSGYHRNIVHHIVPRIGHLKLQDVTSHDLNRLYADLLATGNVKQGGGKGGPLSATTVRQVATILRRALQDALEGQLVVRNPADAARPPRPARTAGSTMRTWTATEVSAFLEATSGDRLHAMWILFATTGLRRGEVLGLHWEDADLDAATASIRKTRLVVDGGVHQGTPKSGHGRVVALAPQSIEGLRAWRRQQVSERLAWGAAWRDTGLVFTDESGEGLHPDRITDQFRRLVDHHQLPKIRLHDLRHTWATLALGAGVPLKVVSENLGHSTIRITADTYSHVTPPMKSDAVAKVADAIFGHR